jgi:hypothetical protein
METLVEIITELRAEIAEIKTMLEKEKETSDTFYKAYKNKENECEDLFIQLKNFQNV